MKDLLIDNFKISYLDINSHNEEALFFIHGNSHAKNSFKDQLESPLLKNYRLIAIDLPGHGNSDKSSQYTLPLFAQVVSELISRLNLKKVLLVGHSLGGHVALHTLEHIRPSGLLIYGTPMLKKPIDFSCFLPNENAAALSKEVSTTHEIELFLTELRYQGEEREIARNNFLQTDPRVRTGILESAVTGNYSDESILLNKFEGKIKVLVSHEENLVNNSYIEETLSTIGKVDSMERISGGHVPHVERKEEFNSILASFANDVFGIKIRNVNINLETQMDASPTI